jgi:hypothetical protein
MMIREPRHLVYSGILAVFLALCVFCAPTSAAAGSWKTVEEFFGTITITEVLDHEAELDRQKHILRKHVSATVFVTGSATDGVYHWPVGTISGTMTTENITINAKDGSTIHGTFSGRIDRRFDREHHGGPGLRVNKQDGLYRITLPHLYAKGTATMTVPVLGTRTEHESKDDAKPFMPARYREGVPYDPKAGVITGGFTHQETIPSYPKPMVVTTTATWNLTFDLAPLRAEAGEVNAVERGEKVTLDGSASTGRIVSYTWTFEDPRDCPAEANVTKSEMTGAKVVLTALCTFTARLTVNDATDKETDTASVTVRPRDWETPFEHVPGEGTLDPSVRPVFDPYLPAYNGGANSCSVDGQSTEDNHILHPGARDGSWEGGGYNLKMVDDQGGPFVGLWYPSEYKLRATRQTLLNKYILPGGPVVLMGLGSFYDKNKKSGKDIDGYLAAVRDHEMEHSRRFKNSLNANDPAEEIEKMAGRDRDALKKKIDEKILKTEQGICQAGGDPLPITWTGELWFAKPDGSGWVLGVTDVGGKNQLQIECH